MAQAARIRVQLGGGTIVGPGLMTFYTAAEDVATVQSNVKAFMGTAIQFMAGGTTYTVPNTGDVIDSNTGQLSSAWTAGTTGTGTATDSTGYVQGVGAVLRWRTGTIVAGHRVTGRTFIVPLAKSKQLAGGVPDTTGLAALLTAAQSLVSATGPGIWIYSRPQPARTRNGVPVPATLGAISKVASVEWSPSLSWLRSRRT